MKTNRILSRAAGPYNKKLPDKWVSFYQTVDECFSQRKIEIDVFAEEFEDKGENAEQPKMISKNNLFRIIQEGETDPVIIWFKGMKKDYYPEMIAAMFDKGTRGIEYYRGKGDIIVKKLYAEAGLDKIDALRERVRKAINLIDYSSLLATAKLLNVSID